jgi:hypothetical protein
MNAAKHASHQICLNRKEKQREAAKQSNRKRKKYGTLFEMARGRVKRPSTEAARG